MDDITLDGIHIDTDVVGCCFVGFLVGLGSCEAAPLSSDFLFAIAAMSNRWFYSRPDFSDAHQAKKKVVFLALPITEE